MDVAPFVVGAVSSVLIGTLMYASAERAAASDVSRLRHSGLPLPTEDEHAVVVAQRHRHRCAALGLALGGSVAAWWAGYAGQFLTFVLVAGVVTGQALGAVVGHLRGIAMSMNHRAATLRRRRLLDYLSPAEVASAGVTVVGVLLVLLIAAVSPLQLLGTAADRVPMWITAGCLLAGAVLFLVAKAVLDSPTSEPTGSRLVWREWVRAQTLRDLRGGVQGLSALAAYAVVMSLLGSWSTLSPGLAVTLTVLLAAVLLSFVVGAVLSWSDRAFTRFRERVAAQVGA